MTKQKVRSPGNPQTRDVNAATRAAKAVELRASKMTYDAIAKQVGYADAQTAHKAVMRELDRVVVRNVDELRTEELKMLDTLHEECWALAIDKNNKYRLAAVDRILAISDKRCKLMNLNMQEEDVAKGMVVIREIPNGYLTGPKSDETINGS